MSRESGMTAIELLITMGLMGIAMGMTILLLSPDDPSVNGGATMLEGMMRQSRQRAIATTSAIRVRPLDANNLMAETAGNCSSGTWTEDTSLAVDLPDSVTLASTAWSVCFGSRGTSSNAMTLTLNHYEGETAQVEIMLGGTTRRLP